MKYLIIPGYKNSGPEHWQTLWQKQYPLQFTRVEQYNWSAPVKEDWIGRINEYVEKLSEPAIIVAHSLGCIAVAHWAIHHQSDNIVGALLVAPADVNNTSNRLLQNFAPVPLNKFPFKSIVVASTNDPHVSTYDAAIFAANWGSRFVCIGEKGHINAASELNDWKEGLTLLNSLKQTQEFVYQT